jgi:hypothetical protein
MKSNDLSGSTASAAGVITVEHPIPPLIYSNSSDGMATKRRPHKLRSFPGPFSYFLPGRTDLGPHRWLTETHIPVCFTAVWYPHLSFLPTLSTSRWDITEQILYSSFHFPLADLPALGDSSTTKRWFTEFLHICPVSTQAWKVSAFLDFDRDKDL